LKVIGLPPALSPLYVAKFEVGILAPSKTRVLPAAVRVVGATPPAQLAAVVQLPSLADPFHVKTAAELIPVTIAKAARAIIIFLVIPYSLVNPRPLARCTKCIAPPAGYKHKYLPFSHNLKSHKVLLPDNFTPRKENADKSPLLYLFHILRLKTIQINWVS
jgi:hypothetical protein